MFWRLIHRIAKALMKTEDLLIFQILWNLCRKFTAQFHIQTLNYPQILPFGGFAAKILVH